ncbi:class II fructose-bisphosphate aldolase [Patescibacteria group bacterium]|nr:class II fructose-bisphosphate aldolase [Patescibacteria group bacterium]
MSDSSQSDNQSNNIDTMVKDLVMTDSIDEKQKIVSDIFEIAKSKGIFLSSVNDLYKAYGEGKCSGFTVPAINLRSLSFYLAKSIFRVAKNNNTGAFIFEIAKSEMGYTHQTPAEYVGVILAAAIKEEHSGPVFIQGDHFQAKLDNFVADRDKEVQVLKNIIENSISAGFLNIDIDTSTLVNLDKENVIEQQRDNFELCAELTKYIRDIQPEGINVSVGGEIGEVGKKNSTAEELKAFMDGYQEALGSDMEGLSKMSIQTGTSHGGVVLPDGSIAQVKVDFETHKELSLFGRKNYGLGGTVQHGASTLPDSAFHNLPENECLEVHLATNFQNMMFDSSLFPNDLREKMYTWIWENMSDEKKEDQTDDQFIYKSRKKALGPFKKEIMNLPEEIKEGIAKELEEKFDFLFKQLKVNDTKDIVSKFIKPNNFHLTFKSSKSELDGEGDD